MGLDLAKIIPSVMFGIVIYSLLTFSFITIGNSYDFAFTTKTFDVNNSFVQAKLLESQTRAKGTDSTANNFFPAIGSLFDVWNLITAPGAIISDLSNIITEFATTIGGGETLAIVFSAILVTITFAITFIILAALFRQGGFRLT